MELYEIYQNNYIKSLSMPYTKDFNDVKYLQ